MDRVGMVVEHDRFGLDDPADLAERLVGRCQGSVGRGGNRHRRGEEVVGIDPAANGADAANRDDAAHPTGEDRRQRPQPTVHHHPELERGRTERIGRRRPVERVGVDMGHVGGDVVDLVPAGVQDRHLVAPASQPVDDERAGRSRPSDDQRPLICHEASLATNSSTVNSGLGWAPMTRTS